MDKAKELDWSRFEFTDLQPNVFADVVLSNTERQQLRELAQEGGPLWKLMKGMLDYKGQLERQFGMVDLFTPEGLHKSRAIQVSIKAIEWHHQMWLDNLTFQPELERTES